MDAQQKTETDIDMYLGVYKYKYIDICIHVYMLYIYICIYSILLNWELIWVGLSATFSSRRMPAFSAWHLLATLEHPTFLDSRRFTAWGGLFGKIPSILWEFSRCVKLSRFCHPVLWRNSKLSQQISWNHHPYSPLATFPHTQLPRLCLRVGKKRVSLSSASQSGPTAFAPYLQIGEAPHFRSLPLKIRHWM